jgi:hypothetical protein
MKTKLMAVALLAGGALFAQPRVSIGVSIGGGYVPRPVYAAPAPVYYMPPCPGPGYQWVNGYWSFDRGRRFYVRGFWRAPVRYAQPRYDARYGNGYRDRDYRDDYGQRHR